MSIQNLMIPTRGGESQYRPYINTGSPLDMINGKYIKGSDGGYVLSGGLGLTTGIISEANKFKTALLNGSFVNALARFPHARLLINDSEYSAVDETRLANMSDLHLEDPTKRAEHISDLESRISIYDPTSDEASSLDNWIDYLRETRDFKIAHYKDYEVETEVLDASTGKPFRMLIPTFSTIDSWTEAMVKQVISKNETITADTEMKDQRTIFMEEGWKKMHLMRQLPSICAKGGLCIGLTGHMGKKFSLDNKPTKKDMVFMGQDETTKAMGSKFYFLMSSIFKISSATPLYDKNDKKLSDYPSSNFTSGTELQQLSINMVRSKNASSGQNFSMVASQKMGVMNGLSYYDALRINKYFGLGAPNKVRSPLLGDMNLGRTKIFDLVMSDYKVKRALELTYQLFVIQSSWTLIDQPVDYTIPIEQFADKLLNGNGYAIDDILNSRGWWTYKEAKPDRELLTLPDIIGIIEGSYKPKFISVS